MKDIVVQLDNVRVSYRINSLKINSLKGFITKLIQRKKIFDYFEALHHVSLTVRKGESVALIGRNGCGKSTLLKVMAGVIIPREGEVQVLERIAPMIELGAGIDLDLNARQNIMLSCMLMGLNRYEAKEKMEDIIDFAEVRQHAESPVRNFSSGMIARLAFSCAIFADPDLFLIDEVLSVGDENFKQKCLDRVMSLRKSNKTIIFVSHSEEQVHQFCDRAYVLEKGGIVKEGNITECFKAYREILASGK